MKTIPLTPETEALARRLVWFEDPLEALEDPIRFAAYAFARGTHDDMKTLRTVLSEADLLEALDHAPLGIIDARSWAYWNAIARLTLPEPNHITPPRNPATILPTRRIMLQKEIRIRA
jgi:hypothetical protein